MLHVSSGRAPGQVPSRSVFQKPNSTGFIHHNIFGFKRSLDIKLWTYFCHNYIGIGKLNLH